MKKIDLNEHLCIQRYRPQTVEDLIAPERVKKIFNAIIQSGRIPNLLLVSKQPGTGKCLRGTEELELVVSDEIYQKMKDSNYI